MMRSVLCIHIGDDELAIIKKWTLKVFNYLKLFSQLEMMRCTGRSPDEQ